VPSFTVVKADHKKDFSGHRGQMSVYSLVVNNEAGEPESCELCQMQRTAPPAPGQTLEGHIEPNSNPEFAPSFKKDYRSDAGRPGGSGSGTFKPRDPSEIAGARHAHNLLVAAHSLTPLPLNVDGKVVQERIDNLEAFACVLDEKTAAISDAAKETKPEPTKSEPELDVPF